MGSEIKTLDYSSSFTSAAPFNVKRKIDKLKQKLRDYLNKERLESTDKVIDLIINEYEQEKKSST